MAAPLPVRPAHPLAPVRKPALRTTVKTDEILLFSPGLNILSSPASASLRQLDYNLPWGRGRGDHNRRYCGLDGSGSGEGKPKARVKVRKHGPECLHTPVCSPWGRNQASYFGPNSRENRLYQ
jgi:hypothetical protein